jgi:hypothetical protein
MICLGVSSLLILLVPVITKSSRARDQSFLNAICILLLLQCWQPALAQTIKHNVSLKDSMDHAPDFSDFIIKAITGGIDVYSLNNTWAYYIVFGSNWTK